MKQLKYIFPIILIFISSSVFACKERAPLENYPLNELSESNIVVIIEVINILVSDDGRYAAVKEFNGKVKYAYNGTVPINSKIKITTAKEKANAVCPINVSSQESYIMVLTPSENSYVLSRFNYLVNGKDVSFSKYNEQLLSKFNKEI